MATLVSGCRKQNKRCYILEFACEVVWIGKTSGRHLDSCWHLVGKNKMEIYVCMGQEGITWVSIERTWIPHMIFRERKSEWAIFRPLWFANSLLSYFLSGWHGFVAQIIRGLNSPLPQTDLWEFNRYQFTATSYSSLPNLLCAQQ